MDVVGIIQGLISAPFICIGWIIVGIVAGALARRLMGARDYPFVQDFILGIAGALVGGFLANLFGLSRPDGGISAFLTSIVIATIGAMVLIGARRVITGRR